MKKKLVRMIISATMIATMAFGLTACGTEQTAVAETTAAVAPAATEKAAVDADEKETVEPADETEATVTEAAEPAETETEKETEAATETENEAASADSSPLVGKWTLEMFEFQFNEDGTGDYLIAGTSMPFTYEDHGDSVYVKFDEDSNGEEHGYRIDGNTLYFEDSMGEEVAYTRS